MTKQGVKLRSLFCFVRYVMGKSLAEVFFAAHIQTLSKRLDFQPVLLYTYNIAITRRSTVTANQTSGQTESTSFLRKNKSGVSI